MSRSKQTRRVINWRIGFAGSAESWCNEKTETLATFLHQAIAKSTTLKCSDSRARYRIWIIQKHSIYHLPLPQYKTNAEESEARLRDAAVDRSNLLFEIAARDEALKFKDQVGEAMMHYMQELLELIKANETALADLRDKNIKVASRRHAKEEF